MSAAERLARFEPISPTEPEGIDTSFADTFLASFSRMAKSQVKTQQAVAVTADDVRAALDRHGDVMDDLRSRRREAEEKNERLVRFILDTVDLVFRLYDTTRASPNAELRSVADTMQEALRPQIERIALTPIPALGEIPDATYHFILSTRPAPDAKGRIVEVARPGYVLDGRVIRKADVVVGS